MDTALFSKLHKINYLAAELDALYHQAALKLGMPDSVMCVLYAIHDNGEKCLLSEIYKQSGVKLSIPPSENWNARESSTLKSIRAGQKWSALPIRAGSMRTGRSSACSMPKSARWKRGRPRKLTRTLP